MTLIFDIPIGFGLISAAVSAISWSLTSMLIPQAVIDRARPTDYSTRWYGREYSAQYNQKQFTALLLWFMRHQKLLPLNTGSSFTMKDVGYSFPLPLFNKPHTVKTMHGNITFWIISHDNVTPVCIGVGTKKLSVWTDNWFLNILSLGLVEPRYYNYQRLMEFLRDEVFAELDIVDIDIETLDNRYSEILQDKQKRRDIRRIEQSRDQDYQPYVCERVNKLISDYQTGLMLR